MAVRLGRTLARWWRRLAGRTDGEVSVVYSPRYRLDVSGLAQDPRRGEKVLSFAAGRGLLARGEVHPAPQISFRDLCRVHDADYLEQLDGATRGDADALTRILGLRLGDAERERVIDMQRRMAGGTKRAVELALGHGGFAFNLGGGLHHAFRDHGERLCLVNDVAAAIAAARAGGFDAPVLVVDLDLHDGDGTRNVFAADASVHTFSIHNASSGTDPDAVASTSLELGTGVGDRTLLSTLHRHLPAVFDAVEPGLTVYLAGTDGAADDTLGDWRMSADGILARDLFVTRLLRSGDAPMVMVTAGGYGREAWRYTARYLTWLLSGETVDPPTSEEETLARYRRLARRFTSRELTGEAGTGSGSGDDADWGLTEADVLGSLGGAPPRHRFLGYYSPHGLELALERTGFFDLLRRRGFRQPTLELDLDNPAGETLRVFAGAERRELLMELRARRDAHVLPDHVVLRIEWLLLQDPRREFTDERPALPGQAHPGLGILADVMALLVLVCDRLGLDGIFFVPSHYHLAAQSHGLLHFLEPADEARFHALEQAVAPLSLADATRAVEAGRVVEAESGEPHPFPTLPMVLPVGERLRRRLESEEYRRAVETAAAQVPRLRLEEAPPPAEAP